MCAVSHGGAHRGWWILVSSLLLVSSAGLGGCQTSVELEFHRPRLERLVPVALRRSPQPQVDLVLLDVQGYAVTDTQRISAAGQTWWMDQLNAGAFALEGFKVHRSSGGGAQPGLVTVAAVRHAPHQTGSHLVLVLDNSSAAALADPDERRIAALRTLVDRVYCRPDASSVAGTCEPRSDVRVSLILLHGGAVEVTVNASTNRAELHGALAAAGARAGGAAPLWDGLDRCRGLLGSQGGGVLLLWSSAVDSGSKQSPATVSGAWSAGLGPIYAIVDSAPGTAVDGITLTEIASRSGGAVLERPGDLQYALLATGAAAIQGRWNLPLSGLDDLPLQVTAGAYTGVGVLSMTLGKSRWSSGFTLPLLPR
jgi:hypothetical protein